jgi:D-3-phosphoglycerate dehydrogenase
MKGTIFIADKLPEAVVARLTAFGCKAVTKTGLDEAGLIQAMQEANPSILIVRSTKVTKPMIAAAKNLSLIVRAGAGYNTIDVEAASERSIYVTNTPGKNAIAVAELAMGLILSLDRNIPDNVADLRKGQWDKNRYSKAEGLFGKKLAVIGTGNIGQELIRRAKAFGVSVVAWSRSLDGEKAAAMGAAYAPSPEAAAAGADIVSVHLALTSDTKNLLGSKFFAAMKDGALFINTARAEVVDEIALLEAVAAKKLRVGTDVFSNEPSKSGPFEHPLASHPSVYGTHHIGASTEQAQAAVADETVRIIGEYVNNGRVLNCVNVMEKTPAKYLLSVRHKDAVGVLAGILRVIRDNNINVQRMENIIFSGASGACANIQIDDPLSADQLKALIASSAHIFEATQTEIE